VLVQAFSRETPIYSVRLENLLYFTVDCVRFGSGSSGNIIIHLSLLSDTCTDYLHRFPLPLFYSKTRTVSKYQFAIHAGSRSTQLHTIHSAVCSKIIQKNILHRFIAFYEQYVTINMRTFAVAKERLDIILLGSEF
jgi:hypothetical protein